MVPVTNASHDYSSGPITQRIRGSIGKVIRRGLGTKNKQSSLHWRPSVNKLLSSSEWKTPAQPNRLPIAQTLLDLPKELRHQIEEYLPWIDAICLRRTCQRLRYESLNSIEVLSLNYRELYSLRKRLDRDHFSILCELEKSAKLNDRLAVCSFCLSIHTRKKFFSSQLSISPQSRQCAAVFRRYLVCGRFWAPPTLLRQGLEEEVSSACDMFAMHHTMPKEESTSARSHGQETISRIIEADKSVPESRTTLSVDETGLVLEHHFHLQAQSTLLHHGWNIPVALCNPFKGLLSLCPHLTVHSAGARLGTMDEVENEYTGSCKEQGCRTRFGWFECSSDSLGWQDLCLRVERRFGWLENLTDEVWLAQ